MWNPVKIIRYTSQIWTKNESSDDSHDELGNSGIVVQLYGQLMFPSSLFFIKRLERDYPVEARQLFGGQGVWNKKWQDEVGIPKLMELRTADKAPNTLGGHVARLYNLYDFEKFWQGRYDLIDKTEVFIRSQEDQTQEKGLRGFFMKRAQKTKFKIDEARMNVNRHNLLSHDFYHVLFRYDTNYIGEICVQALAGWITNTFPPKYLSFVMSIRECIRYRSLEPFHIFREAVKIAKNLPHHFYLTTYYDKLDMDIEEVREKYNIGVPERYIAFSRKIKDLKLDVIHPEYKDLQVEELLDNTL